MRCIVFGGSGFLGSHVADALTERGHETIIFDQYPSKYLSKDQRMVVGDILDTDAVNEAVKGCDAVYHFAGFADLSRALSKPTETAQLNIIGSINVLNAAVAAKVNRFVFASSVYVYSEKGGFYRCSKQAAELYVEEFQKSYDLETTILRYGTLYGPRAGDENAIYRYLRQGMEDNELRWAGTGDELREYIYVKDAAELSVDILDGYVNEYVTITGQHPTRYRDMLNTIREIINRDIPIVFSKKGFCGHYDTTPYSFIPKLGKKLVSNYYTDLGQGLLACLQDIYGDK